MVDTKYLIDLVEQQKPNLKFPFPYTAETWVKDRELAVENYHKHTTWSNLSQTDSATSLEEFAAKGVERSCQCLFSGEHGYQGEWMYVYDCCKNPSFLKKIGAETPPRFRYSVEAYWVKDRHASDATNCHMVLVARTYEAMRKLNYIISMASENGYYYKPRIDLELLFTLSPDDVYVTSACLAGWKYEDADELWLRIWRHFGDSFFLEYQAHDTDRQKELNSHIRDLSNYHGIQTIVGLDTHYISEEDRLKRDNTLLRKGIRYDDEEGWYMDWPTGLVLFQRMQEQGVLNDGEIIRAMMNTHVFVDGCDDVVLNTEFKIPVLPQYQGKTYAERVDELKNILDRQYKKEPETHRTPERIDGLRYEMEQIDGSGTVDYFLMNYHIMKLATTPEYGGHLTTTSRGSAGSYYASKLLGFTTLDRFEAEVPMYPERFITKERILSSHQMPDIDSNCSEQGPFVAATRDLIGEFCCYPLLAVGKLKEKSAFKLYAGVNGVDPQLANDVTTSIDAYNEALKNVDEDDKDQIDIEDYIPDKDLLALYRQSLPYQNIIEQAKVHACAHIVFNGYDGGGDLIGAGDIRYEIGLIRCVSESTGNSEVVACVEGSLLDAYGYVKNDYLIVDVVGIIHKLYAAIGRTVPPVSELRQMVEGDAETWALYERGATCCLNQCENPGTTQKAKRYAPKSVKELAAFIAGIRPGFKSLLNGFLDRIEYTNGEPEIDNLLADCFHYMLYQEAVMKIFTWLGIPMKDSYDTIKKISKKKLVGEQLKAVEDTLKSHWLQHIGNLDNFEPVYQVVKDSARYSFNAAHALSMAFDSLYEAWMKAHHTSKFYEVVLNHYQAKGDKDKIAMLIQEAKEFFGYTVGEYRFGQDHSHFVVDDDTKVIYPSLISIKGIGEQASSDLMQISEGCGDHILDVLLATRGTKINRTVITSLAQIGFFARFGSVKKIESAIELFDRWIGTQAGRKTISIADLPGTGLSIEEIQRYATNVLPSGKISEKRYTITDLYGLVRAMIDVLPADEHPSMVLAKYEYGVLGDITKVDPSVDRHICVAMGLDTKFSPRFVGYCLANGKRQEMRVHKRKDGRNRLIKESFDSVPFEDGDLIYLKNCKRKARQRKVNDKWVAVPGVFDWWVNDYSVIK